MCKLCWTLLVVFVLIFSGIAYKFIVQGSVKDSSDGRLAIQLEASERDLVLSEMRAFLESTQGIIDGVSKDDMKMIAQYANKVGAGSQQGVPASLIRKLPLSFKTLGFDTHSKFDEIALDAEQFGDREHTLSQLSTLMQNCLACHAAYRFEVISDSK